MAEWLLQPTTWIAGIPLLLLLALVTFEIGMAWTIGTMPSGRPVKLGPADWRKVRRIWLVLGLSWPILIGGGIIMIVAPTEVRLIMLGMAAVAVVLAGWALRRRGRWRRHLAEGRCAACGYDLRGTVGHRDDCPECGHRVVRAAA